MTPLQTFAAFWWDFLVGDDWRLAVGLLLAVAGTVLLHQAKLPAWWLLPTSVALLLASSLRQATRQAVIAAYDAGLVEPRSE